MRKSLDWAARIQKEKRENEARRREQERAEKKRADKERFETEERERLDRAYAFRDRRGEESSEISRGSNRAGRDSPHGERGDESFRGDRDRPYRQAPSAPSVEMRGNRGSDQSAFNGSKRDPNAYDRDTDLRDRERDRRPVSAPRGTSTSYYTPRGYDTTRMPKYTVYNGEVMTEDEAAELRRALAESMSEHPEATSKEDPRDSKVSIEIHFNLFLFHSNVLPSILCSHHRDLQSSIQKKRSPSHPTANIAMNPKVVTRLVTIQSRSPVPP